MEMQTYHLDVSHVLGFFNDFQHVAHVNTELVLSQTCGDVGMGMSSHIGVQSESHASHLPFSSCQFVNNLKLWNTLNIETEDVVVQSKVNLPVALANASINYFRAGETSFY